MRNVLIGCGVAAAALIAIAVVGSIFVGTWFKGQLDGVKEVEQAQAELDSRFGPKDDYVPDPLLDENRVRLFVQLSEELQRDRSRLAAEATDVVAEVSGHSERDRGPLQKLGNLLKTSKRGISVAQNGISFMIQRKETLLEAGMGEGEYAYLYSLMAFAWLDWDPLEDLDDGQIEGLPGGHDLVDAADEMRAEYQRIFSRQIRNQRAALRSRPSLTEEESTILSLLDNATSDRSRRHGPFPLQGSLPEEWLRVIEPYRESFRASLPRTPMEFIVESVSLLEDEFETNEGIHVTFGD